MANNDTKNKISIATYGVGTRLDHDSKKEFDIVKQTAIEVANKFGKRLDNKIIDTTTNLSLSNLFSLGQQTDKKNNRRGNPDKEAMDFKDFMQDNAMNATGLLAAEQSRVLSYANYKAIVDNIPEMDLARTTYLSNIMSPDDYNKKIFDIDYRSKDHAEEIKIEADIKKIIDKYEFEDKAEEIVNNTITYGDCFVSVLPYDKEISKYIASTGGNILNESNMDNPVYKMLTETMHLTERMYSNTVTPQLLNESLTTEEHDVLEEAFGNNAEAYFTGLVNDKIQIRSFTDLLRNKANADNDILFSKADTDEIADDKKNKRNKKDKRLNINGCVINILEPERVVPLIVNDVNYGFYYIQPGFQDNSTNPYNNSNPKTYTQSANPMNPAVQNNPQGLQPGDKASISSAKNLNISDEKLNIISQILLKALSKKLNKNYIEDNKQFKDLLYNLLKQKYIIEKGVSIIYFMPEEVIHFHTESIFEKIVFFAKLYLAVLTNTVVVKMGRGHDKRIYYVNSGIENNHEQSIMRVMQDVKTKEFTISKLGSVQSILRLNPGANDDIYLPVVNGEKPVDIEVLQGMDQDMNNDFTDYLRRSMIQGTGLPLALIEAQDNIEFARQISAQNTQYCRRIVGYQKKLTKPFNKLIRTIYKYEHTYTLDGNNSVDNVDIENIKVSFPSPAMLNLTNTIDMLSQLDTEADVIAKRFYPDTSNQENLDKQMEFKYRVIQKKTPQIDWDEFGELYKEFNEEYNKREIIKIVTNPPVDPMADPYGNQGY